MARLEGTGLVLALSQARRHTCGAFCSSSRVSDTVLPADQHIPGCGSAENPPARVTTPSNKDRDTRRHPGKWVRGPAWLRGSESTFSPPPGHRAPGSCSRLGAPRRDPAQGLAPGQAQGPLLRAAQTPAILRLFYQLLVAVEPRSPPTRTPVSHRLHGRTHTAARTEGRFLGHQGGEA